MKMMYLRERPFINVFGVWAFLTVFFGVSGEMAGKLSEKFLLSDSHETLHAHPDPKRKSMDSIRDSVLAVAEPALRSWLHSMSPERLEMYGWTNDRLPHAKLLVPIPYYMPSRSEGDLERNRIEETLDELPLMWLVPVTDGTRIVSLIVVDTLENKPPKAVEFGKSFAANRLDAGIRALKELSTEQWRNLRVLRFFNPNIDLLIFRNRDGVWRWFNLTGTYKGKAIELDADSITGILNKLRKLHL
jgi:hypothetical protein